MIMFTKHKNVPMESKVSTRILVRFTEFLYHYQSNFFYIFVDAPLRVHVPTGWRFAIRTLQAK